LSCDDLADCEELYGQAT